LEASKQYYEEKSFTFTLTQPPTEEKKKRKDAFPRIPQKEDPVIGGQPAMEKRKSLPLGEGK